MLEVPGFHLKASYTGYIDTTDLKYFLNENYAHITSIRADQDELVRCCEILGRPLPKSLNSYIFLGVNAQEIAINWY